MTITLFALVILTALSCRVAALEPSAMREGFQVSDPDRQLHLDLNRGHVLKVYSVIPGNAQIGYYREFKVEYNGEIMSYKDVSFEIVDGFDCAAIYYTGEILALGEGRVTVRAWLDADPSIDGYAFVDIAPSDDQFNRYIMGRDYLSDASFIESGDENFENVIKSFPESYRPYLRDLHFKYPGWIFEPFITGMDFDYAVSVESTENRNVTLLANMADVFKSKTSDDYNRETGEYYLKDTGWVNVNGTAVSYFMDPRNFINERDIFQFEKLTYDERYHTVDGVESILAGTFASKACADYLDSEGNTISSDKTYAEIIMDAARQTGVSPYYLASKIRGEIGSTPSPSVSGEFEGYEGFYNFYNIGAVDGEGNVEKGLLYASGSGSYMRPWDNPESAIIGGSMFIAENYIDSGQNTGYLQKFNVDFNSQYGAFYNQYMTNVSGAVSQSYSTYQGYSEQGVLESPVVFSIPVFENMPKPYYITGSVDFEPVPAAVSRNVYLRSAPSACSDSILPDPLPVGSVLTVTGSVRSAYGYYHPSMFFPYWYQVQYRNSAGELFEGYICSEYVTISAFILESWYSMPLPAGKDESYRYLSDNTYVAAVDSSGIVTAAFPGRAKILVYTSGGGFYSRPVIVP